MTTTRTIRRPTRMPLRAGGLVAIAAILALWAILPAIHASTAEAAGPPDHAAARASDGKDNSKQGKAVGRPSHATGLERASEARNRDNHPGRGHKRGHAPAGPTQLNVQAASNSAEIIQISGDNSTNIATVIQENFQIALNVNFASLDDVPDQLDVYLAQLIASSLDLGENWEILGVQVDGLSGGSGGTQVNYQDAANSVVIAQYTGDDGTNIVVVYQLNIQVSMNISG